MPSSTSAKWGSAALVSARTGPSCRSQVSGPLPLTCISDSRDLQGRSKGWKASSFCHTAWPLSWCSSLPEAPEAPEFQLAKDGWRASEPTLQEVGVALCCLDVTFHISAGDFSLRFGPLSGPSPALKASSFSWKDPSGAGRSQKNEGDHSAKAHFLILIFCKVVAQLWSHSGLVFPDILSFLLLTSESYGIDRTIFFSSNIKKFEYNIKTSKN